MYSCNLPFFLLCENAVHSRSCDLCWFLNSKLQADKNLFIVYTHCYMKYTEYKHNYLIDQCQHLWFFSLSYSFFSPIMSSIKS